MRWLPLVFLLLVSISASAVKKCKGTSKVKKIENHYGSVGWYKKATSVMMRGMIGEISDKTTNSVGQIATNPAKGPELAWGIVKEHGGVMALFIIMLVISVLLFLAMIVVLIYRWCCSSKAQGLTPSLQQIIITLAAFLVCCAICACGAFVYFASLQSVNNGIGDAGNMLNTTTNQISTFVGEYFRDMECNGKENEKELEAFVMRVSADMDSRMQEFVDKIELAKTAGTNIATMVGSLGPIAAAAASGIDAKVDKLKADLDGIKQKMETMKKKMKDKVKDAEKAIKGAYKQLLDAIKIAKDGFQKVEKHLADIVVKSDSYATKITRAVQYTFIIPLILCAIMAFAFVLLIVRFLVNRAQENPEKRGVVSIVGGNVLGVSGYVAMCTGSLLFLLAACIFVIAFASMFFCIGFFDDPDLLILKAVPVLNNRLGHGDITLHSAFVRCRNEFPFFDAIDGAKQLASKHLEDVTKKIADTDFGKEFRNLQLDPSLLQSIEQLKTLFGTNQDVLTFHKLVYQLNSRADRDEMLLGIEEALLNTLDELATMIGRQLETSLDLSPHCDAMNTIWNNVGGFVCNGVSMPAQGAWVACAICGIASFTVFHWMFKSTRYLKNFDNNKKSEELLAIRKSEEKLSKEIANDDVEDVDESRKKKKSKSKPSASNEAPSAKTSKVKPVDPPPLVKETSAKVSKVTKMSKECASKAVDPTRDSSAQGKLVEANASKENISAKGKDLPKSKDSGSRKGNATSKNGKGKEGIPDKSAK